MVSILDGNSEFKVSILDGSSEFKVSILDGNSETGAQCEIKSAIWSV